MGNVKNKSINQSIGYYHDTYRLDTCVKIVDKEFAEVVERLELFNLEKKAKEITPGNKRLNY